MSASIPPAHRLSLGEVRALAEKALGASGLSPEAATVVADVITSAERDECLSHGLFRLPGYCRAVREDGPFAPPEVEIPAPGVVRVDGKEGIAAVAFEAARPLLVDKAKEQGIAVCSLGNIRHFSALWYETEKLAGDHGLAAFAFVNSKAFVAHCGGSRRTYGTNPFSFSFPRRPPLPPVVFDQASSVMARGEMQIALRDGKALPEGAAVTVTGEPTTDPKLALEGAQQTFGGHKGSSIALMVELLAAVATGSPLAIDLMDAPETKPTVNGELLIALNPRLLVGEGSEDHMDAQAEKLFAHILQDEGSRLPGARRARARSRTENEGVSVSLKLYEEILSFCNDVEA